MYRVFNFVSASTGGGGEGEGGGGRGEAGGGGGGGEGTGFSPYSSLTNASPLLGFIGITSWFAPAS